MRRWLVCTFAASLALAAVGGSEELSFNINWQRYLIQIKHHFTPVDKKSTSYHYLRATILEELLLKASIPLEALYIDNQRRLKDILLINPTFAREYALFLQNLSLASAGFKEASVEIPIRGNKSLLAILPLPWQQQHYALLGEEEYLSEAYAVNRLKSEYLPSLAPEKYTGLIVDMRGMEFYPSLAPRIFSEDGRLLYGAEFLSRRVGIERGIAGYAHSLADKELKARAGKRPLYVVALESKGLYRTDAVIAEEDARKLFDHPTTLKNLKKARVVFLIP